VSRRVRLPTADDLFRSTSLSPARSALSGSAIPDAADAPDSKRPSGRVRHDEKMTIYVTAGELVEIEQARLALRSTHGLAVDRGRLVREAVAIALADFEQNGDESVLVQRLIGP
jgi:hypothetical protein